ncbi:MAG: hypothetical protein A3K68_03535 [Euryarchaeota archaeon RBG_16_68_13]|nr:MAG: hypothetical protein A3K68_03535 [Euryarchaeota archaeon RBG_16_68_13]
MRATVVGSYPRIGDVPAEQKLRRAIARRDRGELSEEDVRAAERDVIRDVIAEQEDAGVHIVTDGQIAWHDSLSHVAQGLEGIEIGGLVRYFDTNTYYRQPIVRTAVAWRAPILVEEWRYAQSVATRPVKAVLPGPVTLAGLALDVHYREKRTLVAALASALASEVEALARAGARQIQIDEPLLTRHPEDLALAAEAFSTIAGAKGKANLGVFTYFGDVAKIYRDLLKLPADFLGIDLVQGSKTWTRLEKSGAARPLVLGVVDARNTRVEDPAALAARVGELRHSVDLEACSLSPSNGLEFLPRDRAREKLRLLARTAALVGGAA